MPRVISYIRFSHDRQQFGDSLRRQLERTNDYCTRNKLTLDEGFSFRDLGVSGFKGRNLKDGALGVFVQAVEEGRIERGTILIVESLDRLSRDKVNEALQLFLRIVGAGVQIVTLEPERLHSAESIQNIAVLLEPIIIMSRANEESTTKSSRIGASWEARRRKAREGSANFGKFAPGWIELGEDGKYHLILERAEVVRQIFRMRIEGHGVPSITKALNAGTVKPPHSRRWMNSSVRRILLSRTTFGEFTPGKIIEGKEVDDGPPIPHYYPAAIDENTFYQAQALAGNRRGRTATLGLINLFQGLLIGVDRHPIHLLTLAQTHRNGTKKVYQYLVSAGHSAGVPESVKTRIRYEPYERAFLTWVKELDPTDFLQAAPEVAPLIAETTGRIAHLDHTIAETKKRIKEKPVDLLYDLLGELDRDRKALLSSLETLKAQQSTSNLEAVGEIATLGDLLKKAEGDEAMALRVRIRGRIRQLISNILIVVKPYPGEKVGRNSPRFDVTSMIEFRGGTRGRVLICNQDGELIGTATGTEFRHAKDWRNPDNRK